MASAHALAANAPGSMVPSGSALRALTLQFSEPAPSTPGLPSLWQGLARLTQLTQLRLDQAWGAEDAALEDCLAAVRALSGLRRLTLSNVRASCQQLEEAVAAMTQLTCLQLAGVPVMQRLDLRSLPTSLVELELPSACQVVDEWDPPQGVLFPELRHLKVSHTQIG